ncbi:MAG TPA: antirestriction protein ArdA [Solirubrobacteraceae bacterium]|nr:antirestriction protein ArdA [Solirubrobacteraceae bacterium]
MTTPRIYVACLAAYNAGRLHGAWIDADQDTDALWSEVEEVLRTSPIPGAEEWAIHDHEGFGPLQLSEYESLERVAAIAQGITQHGAAFAAWLAGDDSRDPADLDAFTDAYRGEWPTLRKYAESFADDIGLYEAVERAGSPYVVVDIDMLERDLEIELDVVDSADHTVYVFDPNV